MKSLRIYIPALLVLVAASLSSCLKNQEDFFDTPSNVRMQEYLDKTKAVLTDAPYGWAFDYAPDRNMSYGMILYTLQFTSADVTVGSEIAPGEYETSLYKLTNDNGPCLSFDSYNALMHFYATPSWSNYQALDGDFEFMIMNVETDKITLKGKRTGNFMYLTRLQQEPGKFIEESMAAADNQFLVRAKGTAGGKAVSAFINLDVRYLELTFDERPEEPVGAYFSFSPEGIRFPSPIEINGSTLDALNFSYDAATMDGVYTSSAASGVEVKLNTYIPDDYAFIDEFSGPFTFDYGTSRVNCTLEPNPADKTVLIKGLNPNYDIVASYSKGHGSISLTSQEICVDENGHVFRFCAGNLGGFFSAAGIAGIEFVKDIEKPGTFKAQLSNLPKSKEAGKYFCIVEFIDGSAYWPSQEYRISGDCEFEMKSITRR